MCSRPKTPKIPPPPPPPQEVKTPDVVDRRRRNTQQMASFAGLPGGTLLTGAMGATGGNIGTTLLGGGS